MEENNVGNRYSLQDLNKAFDMGLEMAVFMIEKMIGLTPEGQLEMLEMLKEKIRRNRYHSLQLS